MISTLNWAVIIGVLVISLIIGLGFSYQSTRTGIKGFFTANRSLPWWAIGFSNSATYQSGAAGFVMLVLSFGLVGNWLWWASWVIWMPLVAIVWAPLWHRLGVKTTAEVFSLRYSGKGAVWARKAYAFFSCFGFAVILISYITGFFVKTIAPIMEVSEFEVLLVLGGITVVYTMLGGLKGVVFADVFQFLIFLIGSFLFVFYAVDAAGGTDSILSKIAERDPAKLQQFPPTDEFPLMLLMMLILQGFLFAGSPTAGEGSTAQRFMAAKSEKHAMGGQLFNTFLALCLRAIPMIGLGLVCLTLFTLTEGDTDLVYVEDPAHAWGLLLANTKVPDGLLGLLIATEVVAYVSTLSTLINWGSSFVVNDLVPKKWMKTDQEESRVSRLTTLILFLVSGIIASLFVPDMISWFVFINSAMVIFLLPLSWLRFFWWRFTIWAELAAIVLCIPAAILVWFVLDFQNSMWEGLAILMGSGIGILLLVTWLTPPEKPEKLRVFYSQFRPPGWWKPVKEKEELDRNNKLIIQCAFGILTSFGLVLIANNFWLGFGAVFWVGVACMGLGGYGLLKNLSE